MNKRINRYFLLFCGIFLAVYTGVILSGSEESRYETLRFAQGDIIEHVEDAKIDNAFEENCEHNVPIIECDGCRHEVGVVKVDAEFLKGGGLELVEVKTSTLNSIIEAPGEISTNPDREVHITPRIPGVIKEIYKSLGDKVKAGEVVALLDSIELGQAKADYLKASAMMGLASKNYERIKTLSEKKIVSQKTFIEAESEFERAKIELRALEERLHLLGLKDSDVQKIREHEEARSLLPIIAPIDGTIIEKHAVIGERADPSMGIFRAADLSHLWVWFDIYEKDLAKVEKGQDVSLSVLAYPEEKFEGQVTLIGNMVSEKTRTTKILAEIDNTSGKLKPGMFVTVAVHLKGKEGTLTVPKDSVQSDGADKIVFVPLRDNYFIKKKVILGTATPECYEVLDGLKNGEKVVTKGSFLLKSELQEEKIGGDHVHH